MPLKIGFPGSVDEVLALGPECLVVAAYGQILPSTLIDAPPFGSVNVHASLLPRWRGASPIAHAILAGDTETGVSVMRMEAGLDTGPVYATASVATGAEATTPALTRVLADLGARELLAVLDGLAHGTAVAQPQSTVGVTLAPRLRREDGRVAWAARSAIEVDRMVRALQPWPGVVAPLSGVDVQVQQGAVTDSAFGFAGDVVRHEGESVVVQTRDGGYRIDLDRLRPMAGRLTVTGSEDSQGFYPYECARRLAARLGLALVELPGNHAGMIARPAEFAARLRGLPWAPASGDFAPADEAVTR